MFIWLLRIIRELLVLSRDTSTVLHFATCSSIEKKLPTSYHFPKYWNQNKQLQFLLVPRLYFIFEALIDTHFTNGEILLGFHMWTSSYGWNLSKSSNAKNRYHTELQHFVDWKISGIIFWSIDTDIHENYEFLCFFTFSAHEKVLVLCGNFF